MINRRQFISRMGLAGGGMLLFNGGFFSESTNRVLGPPLLPGDNGPRPRIAVAFSRQQDEYYMGWPGAAYDHKAAQTVYTETLENAADKLGVILDIEAEPLRDNDKTDSFLRRAKKADGVIITCMNLNDGWPAILRFVENKGNLPAIIYAPRGTLFTSRLNDFRDTPYCFVGSVVDTGWLHSALRMLKTVWQMDNTRIALIRSDEVREEKLRPVGTTLCHIPLQRFADAYHATKRSEQVESIAREYIKKARAIMEPSREEIYDAARTYVANRNIMDEYGCHAVTMDCLRLVGEKITPPPCMAYFQLLNEKTCGCCEGDITGALSLMLSSYLFDKPGFLHNPVVDNVNNNYGGAHCVAPTQMDGFGNAEESMILRSHHESDWGVATQVMLRENQPVTLMKFMDPGALWAATGTIMHNVDTQPHDGIGGCRTGFAMAMDNVHDARDIRGHHNVLIYGKYLPELRSWCQLAGIRAEHITGGVL